MPENNGFTASCGPGVPEKWQQFRMWKQGELDYACVFYSLVAAAHWLKAIRLNYSWPLAMFNQGDAEIFLQLTQRGVEPVEYASMATTAGMELSWSDAGLPALVPSSEKAKELWLVNVTREYRNPRARDSTDKLDTDKARHVLLVLESSGDSVVIADSHPWNFDVELVKRAQLDAWMKSARWARKYHAARLINV